jgi:hypothetical protein
VDERVDDLAARAATMDARIRTYFDGCNEADVEKMVACFVPAAVHYFPPGMYGGAWRGARLIAERWAASVATRGSAWTIDRMVCDPASHQAVIEWTHWKTAEGAVLRGDEWYAFEPESLLVKEIRAYYASPQDPTLGRLELDGFDYAGQGYPLDCPVPRPHPSQHASGVAADPPVAQDGTAATDPGDSSDDQDDPDGFAAHPAAPPLRPVGADLGGDPRAVLDRLRRG